MERIKFAKRLEREPDSIEFTKFKNSILSMSKQVTSTYKSALGSIQSNQNREINNLKVKLLRLKYPYQPPKKELLTL